MSAFTILLCVISPHSSKAGNAIYPNLYVQQQQADLSARIVKLESSFRKMNGKIEKMNFLITQLRASIDRMQQNYELRLQKIESGTAWSTSSIKEKPEAKSSRSSYRAVPPPSNMTTPIPDIDLAIPPELLVKPEN